MADTVPPWLESMRADLGVEEIPGPEVNPRIIAKARLPGVKFPNVQGLVAYGLLYTDDDGQAWCGAEAGGCLAEVGIMPPFGPRDTDRYFWAASFRPWGVSCSVRVGAIVCFDGHVTMVNRIIGTSQIECIGGNQGSPKGGAVTKSTRNTADVRACRWPDDASLIAAGLSQFSLSAAPDPTAPPFRPEIKLGSTGGFVTEAQTALGLAATGIFDQRMKDVVWSLQEQHGLTMVDGEIGAETWPVILALKGTPVVPIGAAAGLSPEAIARIVSIAGSSALASVSWKDRGRAPIGYIKGMAVTFAKVYLDLKAGKSSALAMTVPIGDPAKDALAWYGVTESDRPTTLRRLFELLISLGMRESSGKYYEGRDASASNTSAQTAEAGLFQQSFDSFAASAEMPKLFGAYTDSASDGFLSIFREGLSGSPGPGSGTGAQGLAFQSLCKSKPAFAVECAAVGLRVLRQHWGPINRREVELRSEADTLLQQVQQVVDAVVTAPIKEPIIIPPKKPGEPTPQPMPIDTGVGGLVAIGAGIFLLMKFLEQSKMDKSQGIDLSKIIADLPKFIAILQHPTVQKALSGKPVTLHEWLELLPVLLQLLPQPTPALTGPDKSVVEPEPAKKTEPEPAKKTEPPPVTVMPVKEPAPSTTPAWMINLGAGLAALFGSLGLSAGGVVGAPVGPDATLTGALLPLIGMGAAALGIPAPLVAIGKTLFARIRTAPPAKTT